MDLHNIGDKERYLTTPEVSEITGLAIQTLHNHRHRGVGIPYVKLERAVRYALSDVLNFMRAHRIDPEAV